MKYLEWGRTIFIGFDLLCLCNLEYLYTVLTICNEGILFTIYDINCYIVGRTRIVLGIVSICFTMADNMTFLVEYDETISATCYINVFSANCNAISTTLDSTCQFSLLWFCKFRACEEVFFTSPVDEILATPFSPLHT